jgi:AraC family transcriptional regulator, regulatory protein of adaptative response / DNA-3-methyladenine glycosylase II
MLEVYDTPPSVLRERAARRRDRANGATDAAGPSGALCLRLPFRPPIDLARIFGYLGARAVPGVEVVSATEYERTISLPNGPGVARLRIVPAENWVECSLDLADLRDVTAAVQRCRRLLDLDADPLAISGYLAADPVIGPLALGCPGRRSVGAVGGDEIALRAVLGQQVSVAAARRLAGRLAALHGRPLPAGGHETLTHLFPDAATIAGLDPETLPMPRARARALVGLADALASGAVSLHPGADREEAAARLLALPGIGPWTVGYIGMRALSDPDAFPPGDAGVLRALRTLGHRADPGSDAGAAQAWRPWRSYAVHHLWATLESGTKAEEIAS